MRNSSVQDIGSDAVVDPGFDLRVDEAAHDVDEAAHDVYEAAHDVYEAAHDPIPSRSSPRGWVRIVRVMWGMRRRSSWFHRGSEYVLARRVSQGDPGRVASLS
jgi:hypothetical protein